MARVVVFDVTLIAYHAGCAASAWLDVAADIRPCDWTWSAALTSDRGPAGRSYLVKTVGQSWMHAQETAALVRARVGGDVWSAAATRPDISLARARGGGVIGLTFDRDPAWLVSQPDCLQPALDRELLLGWAPLLGSARGRGNA